MEGEGTYKFSDSGSPLSTYEGIFRRNLSDGRRKVMYPGGTIYIGEWEGGYPHGRGRVVYAGGGGIVYEGTWKEGRREGRAGCVLSYPGGSRYEGGFKRGKFHGEGRYVSEGIIYDGSFWRGYVCGTGTVAYGDGRRVTKVWPRGAETGLTLHEAIAQIEREQDRNGRRLEEKERLLGPVRAIRLEKYLDTVRLGIAARRKKDKEEKVEERRRYIREMRKRELELGRRAGGEDSGSER